MYRSIWLEGSRVIDIRCHDRSTPSFIREYFFIESPHVKVPCYCHLLNYHGKALRAQNKALQGCIFFFGSLLDTCPSPPDARFLRLILHTHDNIWLVEFTTPLLRRSMLILDLPIVLNLTAGPSR